MIISFANIDWKEQPMLVLKNLDGTPIQPLAYAHNINANINYNETSEITFDLPAYVNGEKTPHYDDVVGMKIIDWIGVGQFVLVNPSTSNDGVKEIKECKAYSLEYEFTYKTTFIEEGTYEFWNPLAPSGTVIGMILSDYPSWSVGTVDSSLVGVYRTFGSDNQRSYDLMKNDLQDRFQCIFDFDTYLRKINVKAVDSVVAEKPVYLSTENLIKKINVEEDTENIFTVLDVNGADGVDIRSVNPMGTNLIYNLDHFMNASNFSQSMITKWGNWKSTYNSNKTLYYNITVDKVLKEASLAVENAKLTELNSELSTLESLQSTYVEAAAQGIDKSSELAQVKANIASKKTAISTQKSKIDSIKEEIEDALESQQQINTACALSSFFTSGEIAMLDRYFKMDAITEDSFVYQNVSSYNDADTLNNESSASISISNSKIETATYGTSSYYTITGGSISVTCDNVSVSAKIVRASIGKKQNNDYTLCVYCNAGSVTVSEVTTQFSACTITMSGSSLSVSSTTSSMTASAGSTAIYFTRSTSEYEKRSVQWDLLEFGNKELTELCYPSYTFDVDSANFLVADEFEQFKNNLALGSKVYLNIDDSILTPIVIGIEIGFSSSSKFSIKFGDKYSLKDSAFQLVDLLDQSINTGKTTASNRYNYNSFISSGASTKVKDFMSSALDAAKNAVLSGSNQEITIDNSGVRLREWNGTSYKDDQIWMIHNTIAFTDDGWSSAKMAVGKIFDESIESYKLTTDTVRDNTKTYYIDNRGTEWDPEGSTPWSTALYEKVASGSAYGIAAPYIVGTMLAGSNLNIESVKQSGGVSVFKVDADGVKIHNAPLDLSTATSVASTNYGLIKLDPKWGMVAGSSTTSNPLFTYDSTTGEITGIRTDSGASKTSVSDISASDLPNASFWLDMNGNSYFKGTVFATGGKFTGSLSAGTGNNSFNVDSNGNMWVGNAAMASAPFSVTNTGNVKAVNGTFSGYISGTLAGQNGAKIVGTEIYVPSESSPNFKVDSSGNVTLNGSITWGSGAFPVKHLFAATNSSTASDWHETMTDSDKWRKDYLGYQSGGQDVYGTAYQFRGSDGQDFSGYSWITSTRLAETGIETPTISANEVRVSNNFVVGLVTNEGTGEGAYKKFAPKGYMGYATGSSTIFEVQSETEGVALSTSSNTITAETLTPYVIVTGAGARMSYGPDNAVFVTSGGVFKRINGVTTPIGAAVFT